MREVAIPEGVRIPLPKAGPGTRRNAGAGPATVCKGGGRGAAFMPERTACAS